MERVGLLRTGASLALLIAMPAAFAATDPAGTCAAAKRKAVGKCGLDTLKCHAEAARRNAIVDPGCLARAAARLAQSFSRAEQRGGCATSGDADALQAQVDMFVNGALTALPAPPPDPLPCRDGGREAAGRCWYEGAFSESCDQVCANVSRAYDPATESFAGSGGSDANCGTVVQAVWGLTYPYPVGSSTCGAIGCAWTPGALLPLLYRCTDSPTTGDAAIVNFARFCACG